MPLQGPVFAIQSEAAFNPALRLAHRDTVVLRICVHQPRKQKGYAGNDGGFTFAIIADYASYARFELKSTMAVILVIVKTDVS